MGQEWIAGQKKGEKGGERGEGVGYPGKDAKGVGVGNDDVCSFLDTKV